MAYLDKRVGLAYLEKSGISDAYNEEIVVDKSTGEILVKTPHLGNVMSYNYHTRFNNHIQRLTSMSFEHAILNWDVFQLFAESIEFPNVDTIIGENLTPEPIKLGMGVKQMVISVDVDKIRTNDLSISRDLSYDTLVQYEVISEYLGVIQETYSGVMTIHEINAHVFSFAQKNDNIVISKLVVGNSSDISTEFRNITHSILVGVSRNGLYPLSGITIISEASNEQFIDEKFDDTGLVVGGIIAHSGDIRILDPEDYTYDISPGGDG